MQPSQLIELARELADARGGNPGQVHLRRASSTTYYALFHALSRCCADSLIGASQTDRIGAAWNQVYRSLEHRHAAKQCSSRRISAFPSQIADFAALFSFLHEKRHVADYDPLASFAKAPIIADIDEAASVIDAFEAAPPKARQAFAAFVLFKSREV